MREKGMVTEKEMGEKGMAMAMGMGKKQQVALMGQSGVGKRSYRAQAEPERIHIARLPGGDPSSRSESEITQLVC